MLTDPTVIDLPLDLDATSRGEVKILIVRSDLAERAAGINFKSAAAIIIAERKMQEVTSQFDFATYVRPVLQQSRRVLEGLQGMTPEPDAVARPFDELFEIAHNLRGLGGSFNYPLVTQIGDLLCRALKNCTDAPVPRLIRAVDACVGALEVVINNRLTGDGGPSGKALMASLTEMGRKIGAVG